MFTSRCREYNGKVNKKAQIPPALIPIFSTKEVAFVIKLKLNLSNSDYEPVDRIAAQMLETSLTSSSNAPMSNVEPH